MTQSIKILITKLDELKARTKETNEELKLALEDTDVYRDILQAAMETSGTTSRRRLPRCTLTRWL
jgi:hypothetical protein